MNKDYYDILGVDEDATQDQIKKAYRVLANKYHPDKCPDDPEAEAMFKDIVEAYECLIDSQNRLSYDEGAYNGRRKRTLEEKAQLLLAKAFAEVLAALDETNIKHSDPINIMKKSINGTINALRIHIIKLQSDKRKFIEARDRISGTDNLLYDVTNAHIVQSDIVITHDNEQLEEMLIALALLDNYQYKVDEAPEPEWQNQMIGGWFTK